MIVTNTTPPSATYSDLNAGVAYLNGINDPLVKTDDGGATRLDTGEHIATVDPDDPVTPATSAEVSLFPPS